MGTLFKEWFTEDSRYGNTKFYRVFYLKPHHKFCDILERAFKNNIRMRDKINKFRWHYLHLGR